MVYIKKHMKSLSYCLYIVIIVCFALPVYATDSNLGLQFNNLTLQDNGGDTKCEVIKGNGHMVLSTNTTGLKKGYYTSQFSVKDKEDWSSYGQIYFYMKNLSNKPVKINLFVILKDGTYITGDKFVLWKKENNKHMNLSNMKDGMFEFNNDFAGIVYIPFQNFKANIKDLKNVVSFGISVTTEENVIEKIEVGDFKLEEFSGFEIIGDKNIIKPIVGESIAEYTLKNKNKNKVFFYLKEKTEGVLITKDGRLTVSKEATCEKINIKAVINNKLNVIFQVGLSNSSILNLKDTEGFDLAVPKVDEVQSIISSKNIFNGTDRLILFRFIAILISTAILIFYFIWRRKWKKQKRS